MKRILILFILFSIITPGLTVAQIDSQWEENLDVLITELPQRHIDPFARVSETEFMLAAEDLRADIPNLNDQQILMRMAALVAMLGDSHTALNWQMDAPIYPVGLLAFDDGIYAVAAPVADVPGKRLTGINDHPIQDVISVVQTIIPHENEAWLKAQLPNFIVRSEVLIGLGIIEELETVRWEFETDTGEIIAVEIAPIPQQDIDPSAFLFARSTAPRTEDTNGFYWLEFFEDGTLYFKYNSATEASDLPFSQFTEILLNMLEEQPVERLVIDLRSNTGGNSTLLDPLITTLKDHPINAPGRLFVIIGARTYSSALLNAVRLKQETNAVLVGQATGGAPNHFGEIQRFDLPYFNMNVTYSTKYHETMPGVQANTLEPDVLVPLLIEDHIAGIDPFYAAVLNYQR